MKTTLHTPKSTLLALFFFLAMALVGSITLHAQDTVNPLLSTTGPNVLSSGHIYWNTTLRWDHMRYTYSDYFRQLDGFDANTGLRFGIGSRAELTLGLEAFHYSIQTNWKYSGLNQSNMEGSNLTQDNLSFAPSVGARLLLFEGKRWLLKVTFNTAVALAATHGRQ
ncbi:MAG: hypothetical protein IJ785_00560 [Bacteroidales bacterium]|nr:hypothetical protein [Bacteroidales bacterium]